MTRAPAGAAILRRRLSFLEAVLPAFAGVQDEEQSLEAVGRLAVQHLASACWIYLREEKGAARLAHAAQAGPGRPPTSPPGLHERVQALVGRRARKPGRARTGSPIRMVLLEHGGDRFGVLALLPARMPGPVLEWMSGLLAAQAAAALARARASSRLQRAVLLRDDVFVAAAHELGNSLGALALQVRAMLNEPSVRSSGSPFAPRLEAMDFQVSRLIGLNRRMLDSSRLGSGKFPLLLEAVDAAAVVREALARNADELAWRRCKVDYRDPGPLRGQWDRDLLDQIFSNLLSNAMKYGHGQPISVSLRGSARTLQLRIQDRGIGIAKGDHQRIFEKFERAAPLEQGTSLGIGLWLVQRMTRAMGGTIDLTSAPGAGSIFTVKLPRKTPSWRTAREVSK